MPDSPHTVSDVMTHTAVAVGRHATYKEIVELMEQWKVSALPVLEGEGRVIGVVSEADLLPKEEYRFDDPAQADRPLSDVAKARAVPQARRGHRRRDPSYRHQTPAIRGRGGGLRHGRRGHPSRQPPGPGAGLPARPGRPCGRRRRGHPPEPQRPGTVSALNSTQHQIGRLSCHLGASPPHGDADVRLS